MKAREPTNGLSIEKLKLENIEFSTILTNQEEEEATEAPNKCNLQSASQSASRREWFIFIIGLLQRSLRVPLVPLAGCVTFFLSLTHSFVVWIVCILALYEKYSYLFLYSNSVFVSFYDPILLIFGIHHPLASAQLSSAHRQRRHCRRGRRRCCFTSRAVLLFSNRCQERWRKKL